MKCSQTFLRKASLFFGKTHATSTLWPHRFKQFAIRGNFPWNTAIKRCSAGRKRLIETLIGRNRGCFEKKSSLFMKVIHTNAQVTISVYQASVSRNQAQDRTVEQNFTSGDPSIETPIEEV